MNTKIFSGGCGGSFKRRGGKKQQPQQSADAGGDFSGALYH
jgi:hypothetical protein